MNLSGDESGYLKVIECKSKSKILKGTVRRVTSDEPKSFFDFSKPYSVIKLEALMLAHHKDRPNRFELRNEQKHSQRKKR
jgi:hypothetical protein